MHYTLHFIYVFIYAFIHYIHFLFYYIILFLNFGFIVSFYTFISFIITFFHFFTQHTLFISHVSHCLHHLRTLLYIIFSPHTYDLSHTFIFSFMHIYLIHPGPLTVFTLFLFCFSVYHCIALVSLFSRHIIRPRIATHSHHIHLLTFHISHFHSILLYSN